MQELCLQLRDRLLKSLDEENNVTNMQAVMEIVTTLETMSITKQVLEATRLGKLVNDFRRKTNNVELAKRAKDLVRRWRTLLTTNEPTPADTAPAALNGARPHSPALRSPALRGLQPQSPLLKATTSLRALSPALSMHSETSCSPNVFPSRQATTVTSNHRLNFTNALPESRPSNQNHTTEAVPRTHSSNKRLRKDEPNIKPHCSLQNDTSQTDGMPNAKRPRLNGEAASNSVNSQVPSPSSNEQNSQPLECALSPDCNLILKKRGRKKGSKSMKSHLEDDVKEKLANIARNPKVKTTQELLADLQARGSNSNLNLNLLPSHSMNPPNVEDVLRSEDGTKSKYLRSTQNNCSENTLHGRLSPDENRRNSSKLGKFDTECDSKLPEGHSRPWQNLSVEEILAKLPPLDPKSIEWSDSEDGRDDDESGIDRPPREVTVEDLKRLHNECVEGLNGNFQPKLSSLTSENKKADIEDDAVNVKKLGLYRRANERSDEEFREWHEMLARPSFDGQMLHILPYVIID